MYGLSLQRKEGILLSPILLPSLSLFISFTLSPSSSYKGSTPPLSPFQSRRPRSSAISFLISVFFSSTCLLLSIFFLCSLFHYFSLSLSFNFYFAIFYLHTLSLFLFLSLLKCSVLIHPSQLIPSFLISFLLHRLFFFFLP